VTLSSHQFFRADNLDGIGSKYSVEAAQEFLTNGAAPSAAQ
jgi:hypothetical protein